jgi:hypothetical protein
VGPAEREQDFKGLLRGVRDEVVGPRGASPGPDLNQPQTTQLIGGPAIARADSGITMKLVEHQC